MGCCSSSSSTLICYCFNITESSFRESIFQKQDEKIFQFIVFQTKNNYCNCSELNPSKICCLAKLKRIKHEISS